MVSTMLRSSQTALDQAYPSEDPANLDERRVRVGLTPEREYEKQMEELGFCRAFK